MGLMIQVGEYCDGRNLWKIFDSKLFWAKETKLLAKGEMLAADWSLMKEKKV